MKTSKILILLCIILILSPIVSAKFDYARKESRNCPYCHSSQGPPQLNNRGVYYATHNHSFEGYVPPPKVTPTPKPTEKIEIGVHMTVWDVGMIVMSVLIAMMIVVYIIRL